MPPPNVVANAYLYFRGMISDSDLKSKTLEMLQRFQELIGSTSQEQLERRSGNERWNGIEVTFHAVNSAKGILRTCEALRAKQNVADSDASHAGRTRIVSRDDLMGLIKRVYNLTDKFDFKKVKTASTAHPYLGRKDFQQWLVLNLIHLERHYRQLNRVLSN
jgi:DinB superfamily